MKKRHFYFGVDDHFSQIDFGNWFLVLYYAKSISLSQFKILYELSFSAYRFYSYFLDCCRERHEAWGQFKNSFYDSSQEPVSELCLMSQVSLNKDSYEVLFDQTKLEAVHLFIGQIIMKLETESLDLLDLYGGERCFIESVYADNDFIEIAFYEDEERYCHNTLNIAILRDLNKNIFKHCLLKRKPYEVFID